MSKSTTIIGYIAPVSEMPAIDVDNGNARYDWIRSNMKSTQRRGHWNIASCEAIAAKMGIVDGLGIKHHN